MTAKNNDIEISNDPNEVNMVCLVLDGLGTLQDGPQWGLCKCAVCTRAQKELAEAS